MPNSNDNQNLFLSPNSLEVDQSFYNNKTENNFSFGEYKIDEDQPYLKILKNSGVYNVGLGLGHFAKSAVSPIEYPARAIYSLAKGNNYTLTQGLKDGTCYTGEVKSAVSPIGYPARAIYSLAKGNNYTLTQGLKDGTYYTGENLLKGLGQTGFGIYTGVKNTQIFQTGYNDLYNIGLGTSELLAPIYYPAKEFYNYQSGKDYSILNGFKEGFNPEHIYQGVDHLLKPVTSKIEYATGANLDIQEDMKNIGQGIGNVLHGSFAPLYYPTKGLYNAATNGDYTITQGLQDGFNNVQDIFKGADTILKPVTSKIDHIAGFNSQEDMQNIGRGVGDVLHGVVAPLYYPAKGLYSAVSGKKDYSMYQGLKDGLYNPFYYSGLGLYNITKPVTSKFFEPMLKAIDFITGGDDKKAISYSNKTFLGLGLASLAFASPFLIPFGVAGYLAYKRYKSPNEIKNNDIVDRDEIKNKVSKMLSETPSKNLIDDNFDFSTPKQEKIAELDDKNPVDNKIKPQQPDNTGHVINEPKNENQQNDIFSNQDDKKSMTSHRQEKPPTTIDQLKEASALNKQHIKNNEVLI